MRFKLILVSMLLSAAIGRAQEDTSASRVFVFRHVDTIQDFQELTTMIRAISDVQKVILDESKKSMLVVGKPSQIAVAEWLFTDLDRQNLPDSVTEEFRVANNVEDVVRVFYLPNTATVQAFQEVATTVRGAVEIRKVFTYNSRRVVVARGTADQIATAGWLVKELDRPSNVERVNSSAHTMIDTNNRGDTDLRVFYLPYASSVQEFQEAATLVRAIGEIRRVFTYNAPKAVVVRGNSDQLALAGWLFNEMGKPVNPETAASAVYSFPDLSKEHANSVRLFYVKNVDSVQEFQGVVTNIRQTAKIRRVFAYNSTRAMAVRGTPEEVSAAERILQERQVAAK